MTQLFLQIINFYLKLISESQNDVQVFSSFFYTKLVAAGVDGVSHWMKDTTVNLLNKRLLLVPVHQGTHWCLATVNLEHHEICYYDSMKGTNGTCLKLLKEYMMSLSYLQTNNRWSVVFPQNIPHQTNHSDCGVFVCMYARQLAYSRPFNFSLEDITKIRRHMIIELLFKKLL